MAARWFCDGCGQELADNYNWADRLRPEKSMNGCRFKVESFIVVKDGTNGPDLCRDCMAELLAAPYLEKNRRR
jgi:hypothetical protein